MSDIFFKPYLNEKTVYFPYTREALCSRPIFPALCFDGGAFFFANDRFGTADGDALLEKIMSGELFAYWTRNGEFDWSAVFRDCQAAGKKREWEGHIWINRLYILLPLAQAYCKTKDAVYAKKWLELLHSFTEANPYTLYEDKPVDLIWRDMQVTWRSISLVFSIFLLGECPVFAREDWEFIYQTVKTHANHMIGEGIRYAKLTAPDNHRLQIATSLIMFATLFPSFFDGELFLKTATEILVLNMNTSIFNDGCNNEDSMSYSHFIARLYLEAELYLTKNGFPAIPGVAQTIQNQYAFLYRFASPAGKTLQIGDSYVFDAFADIEFVNSFYPLTFPREHTSCVFEHSRMAVLRNERYALYVDAMDMTEWHQHFGRPQFVLFADGLPLIVDSGSINYDRGLLRHELNSERGHNVLYCEKLPLTVNPSVEQLKIESSDLTAEPQTLKIANTVTSPDGSISYVWMRTFALYADRLEITDDVRADQVLPFTLRLHLPDCRSGYYSPLTSDTEFVLRFGSQIETVTTQKEFALLFMPCVDGNNKMNYACILDRRFEGDAFSEKTVIRLDDLR